MAGEIYIADKQTLDSVKQDTTTLLAKGSIKSVQKGKVSTSNSNNSYIVTISPVNVEKSILIVDSRNMYNGSTAYGSYYFAVGEITNGTTITLSPTREDRGTYSYELYWQVVEFN